MSARSGRTGWSRSSTSALPKLVAKAPDHCSPEDEKAGLRVRNCTLPPRASLPYSALEGPRTTSMPSSAAGSTRLKKVLTPPRCAEVVKRMPSMKTLTLVPVRPRTKKPPMVGLVRCTFRPTSSFAACAISALARRAMSSSPMTFTRCGTCSRASARPGLAVTVTSSWNASGCSATSRPSPCCPAPTRTATRRGANPSNSARRTYEPAGTPVKRKAPAASLRAAAAMDPSGLSRETEAWATTAPSGSLTTPATVPPSADPFAAPAAATRGHARDARTMAARRAAPFEWSAIEIPPPSKPRL